MIHRKKVKRDVYDYDYIGVVEDVADPLRLGRARVRIESLHGRTTDKKFIPTEYLPWYEPSSRGLSFATTCVGRVVYVAFETDDYYKGSFFADEHYNLNLQDKLDSYSLDDYQKFYAFNFDSDLQHYYEPHKGLIYDYKKSYILISDESDISICLKDNTSSMYIGSEDASQAMMLGDNWMNWMDTLIKTLQTVSFIGNLGAPVVPSPGMIAVIEQYNILRSSFLSKHIFVANNNNIKSNDRKFDKELWSDNYKNENNISNPKPSNIISTPAPPVKRKEGVSNPSKPVFKIPSNSAEKKMVTTIQYAGMDDDVKMRFINPTSISNGKYDISSLRVSSYLKKNYSDINDERQYLLEEVATSLDKMLDDFNLIKDSSFADIAATKGYVNYDRQSNAKKLNSSLPSPGTDPFGHANQVELTISNPYTSDPVYQNIDDAYFDYFNNKYNQEVPELKTFDWLMKNSKKYDIVLAGTKTNTGSYQWWHFIYKKQEKKEEVVVVAETKPVEEVKKSEKLTPEQLLVDDYIRDLSLIHI